MRVIGSDDPIELQMVAGRVFYDLNRLAYYREGAREILQVNDGLTKLVSIQGH